MSLTNPIKYRLIVGSLLSTVVLTGCVSQSDYDALKAQNQQLQDQVTDCASGVAGVIRTYKVLRNVPDTGNMAGYASSLRAFVA
jgi:hypothetical protein